MDIYNKEKEYCIYKITNLISGKGYIGQTKRFKRRMWEHCHLNNGSLISRSILKHKKENFSFELIRSNLLIEEANTQESYYIDHYDTLSPNGYNLTTGGENYTVSEETRKKISDNHYDVSGINNPMYNKFHSEETKQSQSNSKLGHSLIWLESDKRDEIIEIISEKNRTKFLITYKDGYKEITKNLPQFCKDNNLSYSCMTGIANGRNNPIHKGFKCEHYIDGVSSLEIEIPIEVIVKYKKYLITFPDGYKEISDNLKQFCKEYNLTYQCMCSIANNHGNSKTHKGFKCEYYKEEAVNIAL